MHFEKSVHVYIYIDLGMSSLATNGNHFSSTMCVEYCSCLQQTHSVQTLPLTGIVSQSNDTVTHEQNQISFWSDKMAARKNGRLADTMYEDMTTQSKFQFLLVFRGHYVHTIHLKQAILGVQ